LWLVVEPGTEPAGDMRLHSFDGGLYAVMRCPVPQGNYEVIGATWKQLVAWREDSPYQYATHQWLEKSVLSPLWNIPMPAGVEFALDLYLPITE
jgi:DNA gyrase inhibitor GyrI